MKPVYEIKFLSSNDFDKLPVNETNGSDISDSLGFYNPHTNRVFIRHTSIPELDKYLLQHEFDHLIEKDPTDEDRNGIRHKKFFKEFFLPSLTGGMYSGGEEGGVYNAGASDGNKFQPVGFLGNAGGTTSAMSGGSPDKKLREKEAQAAAEKEQMDKLFAAFGGYGTQNRSSAGSMNFGSSVSPMANQQQGASGLNQGLNQESINPLADPYAKFGQQSGRIYNF